MAKPVPVDDFKKPHPQKAGVSLDALVPKRRLGRTMDLQMRLALDWWKGEPAARGFEANADSMRPCSNDKTQSSRIGQFSDLYRDTSNKSKVFRLASDLRRVTPSSIK